MKNQKQKRRTSSEFVTERSVPQAGVIPLLKAMVDTLPEDMRPHGEGIVGIFTLAIIAATAIFMIAAVVASLTGHSDQIMNIFALDITLVGIIAVGAIVRKMKKPL